MAWAMRPRESDQGALRVARGEPGGCDEGQIAPGGTVPGRELGIRREGGSRYRHCKTAGDLPGVSLSRPADRLGWTLTALQGSPYLRVLAKLAHFFGDVGSRTSGHAQAKQQA